MVESLRKFCREKNEMEILKAQEEHKHTECFWKLWWDYILRRCSILVNILMLKQKAMPSETTYSGTIFWQDQCMRPHPWHLFSVVGGNSPHYAATTVTQLFLKKRCTKDICVYNVCMTSSCIFRGKKALSKKKLKRRQKVKSKVKARTKVWGLFKTNYVAMLLFIFYVVLSYKTIVGLTLDQLLNK